MKDIQNKILEIFLPFPPCRGCKGSQRPGTTPLQTAKYCQQSTKQVGKNKKVRYMSQRVSRFLYSTECRHFSPRGGWEGREREFAGEPSTDGK